MNYPMSLTYAISFLLWLDLENLKIINGKADGRQLGCGFPGRPANGKIKTDKDEYEVYELVDFTCLPGYKLRGNASNQCTHNSIWKYEIPFCDLNVAFKLTVVSGTSTKKNVSFLVDGILDTCVFFESNTQNIWWGVDLNRKYRISEVRLQLKLDGLFSLSGLSVSVGDEFEGNLWFRQCSNNDYQKHFNSITEIMFCNNEGFAGEIVKVENSGHSSKESSICEIEVYTVQDHKNCGTPDRMPGCLSKITNPNRGLQTVTYEPKLGFALSGGSAERHCQPDKGKWTGEAPKCIPANLGCNQPKPIPNGYVQTAKDSYLINEKVTYICEQGYIQLNRQPTAECIGNYEWTPSPTCEKNLVFKQKIQFFNGKENADRNLVLDENISTCQTLEKDAETTVWWLISFNRTLFIVPRIRLIGIFELRNKNPQDYDKNTIDIQIRKDDGHQFSCQEIKFNKTTSTTYNLDVIIDCSKDEKIEGDQLYVKVKLYPEFRFKMCEIQVFSTILTTEDGKVASVKSITENNANTMESKTEKDMMLIYILAPTGMVSVTILISIALVISVRKYRQRTGSFSSLEKSRPTEKTNPKPRTTSSYSTHQQPPKLYNNTTDIQWEPEEHPFEAIYEEIEERDEISQDKPHDKTFITLTDFRKSNTKSVNKISRARSVVVYPDSQSDRMRSMKRVTSITSSGCVEDSDADGYLLPSPQYEKHEYAIMT